MARMERGFWDQRFGVPEYVYGQEPNDFIRAEVHRIPPGPVLCLAEGEGRNAVFLAARGHAVTMVDWSPAGLAKARALAEARGVALTLVEADLARYSPPAGAFSGVVSVFAHTDPEIRQRIHGLVKETLAPGGVFLLEAYSPAQLAYATGGPRDLAYLMSAEQLRRELVGLDLVVAHELERDIFESPLHHGRSATVQIVGFRRS